MGLTQNQYIDSKGAVVSTLMDMTSFKSTEARCSLNTQRTGIWHGELMLSGWRRITI